MPKPILLAAAGAGVLVVAAALYFLVLKGSGDQAVADAAEPATPVTVEGKLGPHLTLPDRVFTLNSPPDAQRYLKLGVVLEFETTDAKWFALSGEPLKVALEELKAELPVVLIEDAITTTVSMKKIADLSTTAGKDQLRQEIQEAVTHLVPEHRVRRVLFVNFVTQ